VTDPAQQTGTDSFGANEDAHVVETVNVGSDLGIDESFVSKQPESFKRTVPERQEDTRKLLAIGFSIATFAVGVAYIFVPVWAHNDSWDRAGSAFQTVFTAMVGITGTAIGYYFSTSQHDK
jgi:putative Mn2+ efflux pump MntP